MMDILNRLLRGKGLAITRTYDGHIAKIFRHHAIDHVVDVGANRGQFAAIVRASGYQGALTCFEPNPVEAAKIPEWLNATVRPVLLSSHSGIRTQLRVYRSSDFSSTYPLSTKLAGRYNLDANDFETLEIDSSTVDDQDIDGDSIYFKIDTQGSEAKILAGGTGLLKRTKIVQMEIPFLQLYEGTPSTSVLLDLLSSTGFHLTRLYPVTYYGECIVDADAFFERLPV